MNLIQINIFVSNMKKLFPIILILILTSGLKHSVFGQNPLNTDGTAFTVPIKTLELSLFRPAKFGLTEKDELSAHPLAFFVMPHIFYKRQWLRFELFNQRFLVSSRHGIYYPKFALNLNQRLPFGFTHFQPEDTNVPGALAFQSEVLVSHYLHEPDHCSAGDYLITARLGFKYALKFSQIDEPLINQSILYRETAVLIPGFIWYVGADLDGHLNYTYNYFADLDYYAYGFVNNYSLESKLGISGYYGKHFSGFAGLKLAFSTMPGHNRFLVMPIAGFSYFIDMRKRKKNGTDLFGRKKPFKHDNSLERDDKYYEDSEKRKNLADTIQ